MALPAIIATMPNSIDAVDERIIHLLSQDAWQSSETLAKQIGVSSATVRRRIKKLVKNGTLRVGAFVDPVKIGQPLAAVIALGVPHDKVDSVAEKLAARPEVKWVSSTTGRFDILTLIRLGSTDELANFVQKELPKLEAIKSSETFICLHINKGYYIPL